MLPAAAVRNLGGHSPAGIFHVVIARFARSEESTGVDSEERQSLSEEKLLRSLSEPVSGKPTPRLVGTRCARGDESGGRSPAEFGAQVGLRARISSFFFQNTQKKACIGKEIGVYSRRARCGNRCSVGGIGRRVRLRI